MDQKDEEINCQQPILEDEVTVRTVAPPDVNANGRILVKLKLHKMPEDVEEKVVAGAAAGATDQEIKKHWCKECNKSFSSGKALGGHMSSAHVQASKDYSYKKQSSKVKSSRQLQSPGSAAAADNNKCTICKKVFQSKKSLFGHMRCHPERVWRGMEPPANMMVDSPETLSERNQDYDEEDKIDSGSPTADVGCGLKGWPTAIKRGRGPMSPLIRVPDSSSEEKETFVAGHELIRLLKDESGKRKEPVFSNGPEFDLLKKKKLGYGDSKLKLLEREAIGDALEVRRKMSYNGKGKEKEQAPQESDYTAGSTCDELYRTAIEVLMSGKRNKIEKQKRIMEGKMMTTETKTEIMIPTQQKGDHSEKSSPEKYICNICHRSFPTHQALGGHRSSHNKFKLSIINTEDRRANIQSTTEKVGLGFDLNMMPEEEYKDGDGDLI